MSYQIEEKKVAQAYNLHVWVEHERNIEALLEAFDTLAYILHLQVIEPMKPHHGRFPAAVFVQVPSELYAKPIRGKVLFILGVNREVQH